MKATIIKEKRNDRGRHNYRVVWPQDHQFTVNEVVDEITESLANNDNGIPAKKISKATVVHELKSALKSNQLHVVGTRKNTGGRPSKVYAVTPEQENTIIV